MAQGRMSLVECSPGPSVGGLPGSFRPEEDSGTDMSVSGGVSHQGCTCCAAQDLGVTELPRARFCETGWDLKLGGSSHTIAREQGLKTRLHCCSGMAGLS